MNYAAPNKPYGNQESSMKERPILFTAPMVRALLAGRKTQTRRIAKITPDDCEDLGIFYAEHLCPYGQPGDRLWVREGFLPRAAGTAALYRADYTDVDAAGLSGMYSDRGRWKPSIHMPRWASRITLEIVSIHVERLQDISEADALAEGVRATGDGAFHIESDTFRAPDADECYARLWESLNGYGSWALNPWVWVVEFKRIAQ